MKEGTQLHHHLLEDRQLRHLQVEDQQVHYYQVEDRHLQHQAEERQLSSLHPADDVVFTFVLQRPSTIQSSAQTMHVNDSTFTLFTLTKG